MEGTEGVSFHRGPDDQIQHVALLVEVGLNRADCDVNEYKRKLAVTTGKNLVELRFDTAFIPTVMDLPPFFSGELSSRDGERDTYNVMQVYGGGVIIKPPAQMGGRQHIAVIGHAPKNLPPNTRNITVIMQDIFRANVDWWQALQVGLANVHGFDFFAGLLRPETKVALPEPPQGVEEKEERRDNVDFLKLLGSLK